MSNIRSSRPVRNARPMQRRNGGGGSSNGGMNNGRRPSNSRRGSENISVGNAISHRERYLEKAKEALSDGDRVSAENFFQHADHYNRIVISAEERRQYMEAEEFAGADVTGNQESNNEHKEKPETSNGLDFAGEPIESVEGAAAV